MLVSFALRNYTCFRDRQELSLQATPRSSEVHAFDTGCPQAPRLNRVTAIYGPNGTGKTSLVRALMAVRQLVLGSWRDRQEGDPLPHIPFLFDRDTRMQPSLFEISFIEDGAYYEYRFSHDRQRVHQESLFGWPPGGRKRLLLNRGWNPDRREYDWAFGHSVTGPKEVWRRSTRANALLVSVAAQLNSPTFIPVVTWFRRLGGITTDSRADRSTAEAILLGEERKRRVLEFLHDSDICVADLHTREETRSFDFVKEDPPAGWLRKASRSGAQSADSFRTRFAHAVPGDDEVHWVDLEDESEGTQRVFALAWPLIEAVEQNRIVVIDELDRSVHPILLDSLIQRVNSEDADEEDPPRRAQLVATLHDVSRLRSTFGRSQVWFTDKSRRSESTTIAPLSASRPRKEEALERGYLDGRYGAIPLPSAPDAVVTR